MGNIYTSKVFINEEMHQAVKEVLDSGTFIFGKKTKEFDAARETGVMLEKIYNEIKIISEGQASLRDKLDATMGMVAKSREDITMLTINISTIKDELTRINGKIAKIDADIAVIKNDFGKRLTHLEALK